MLDARCSKLAARSSQPESRAPFAHLDGQQCAHVTSTLRSSHRLSHPPVRQNVGQAFVPRRIQATPQHNSLAAQRARAAQERGGVTVARRRREARPAGGRLGASRSRPDHQRGRQPFPPTRSLSLCVIHQGSVHQIRSSPSDHAINGRLCHRRAPSAAGGICSLDPCRPRSHNERCR